MRNKVLRTIILAAILGSCMSVQAQDLELHGFYGWQLHGKANLYDGEFRITDAPNYGGKLAVGLSTSTFVELSYMRSETEGVFYEYYTGSSSERIPFSSNYIQVGALQQMNMGRISPFGTMGMGLVVWSPQTSALNSKTQFHISLGAGVKIWLTDFLGIRLQGNMLMPMVFQGFGFGCGIGTGGSSCGGTAYTRITPFQGEFSGGIILRIQQ